VNILLWHVHGSWTTAFVQGPHTYVVPVLPDRSSDGLGRARTWEWPPSVIEVPPERLATLPFDVLILQRPHELELAQQWLGRKPGRDLATVYVEHNCPQGHIDQMRHPIAGRCDITLVHVTHFNDLFWDSGTAPTRVIEHGIVDPGYRYSGELPHCAVAINEPVRRARVTGTDLIDRFAAVAPVDVFGMRVTPLEGPRIHTFDDLPQAAMHHELARRRLYVHPMRWTSLGLSLLEAMHLGMPVVALGTTEAIRAIPPGAGIIDTKVAVLLDAARELINHEALARKIGERARTVALQRYGLKRFLADWELLFNEVA